MKEIRCSFTGHFYVSVEDDATPDDIENAVERYVVAIEDVSLDIKNGEYLSFVGPSGCGKSTLLNIIGGIDVIMCL